jgi:cytochrome c553
MSNDMAIAATIVKPEEASLPIQPTPSKTLATSTAFDDGSCGSCHGRHVSTGNVRVQFYPALWDRNEGCYRFVLVTAVSSLAYIARMK